MSAILATDQLTRHFSGVQAAQAVSLSVAAGSIHGLIGPNGSGKTTVFNCLTGIYPLTSGSISFQGGRIDGKPPHLIARRGIARTFQNLRLFKGMTSLENVLVGAHLHQKTGTISILSAIIELGGRDSGGIAEARELLDFCGLKGKEDDLSGSLSYGLQKRLEIARALAVKPKLLLLDEPAAGMNPSEAGELNSLIRAIRDKEITILLIEHNVKLVMGLCDRVTVMESGRVIADDDPVAVVRNARVIEAYLGTASGGHS